MDTFNVSNSSGHILLAGPMASGKSETAHMLARDLSDQIRHVSGTSPITTFNSNKVVTVIDELVPSKCQFLNGPLDHSTKVKARWIACTGCLGDLPGDTVSRFSCLVLSQPRVDDAAVVAKFLDISPDQADAVLQSWNNQSSREMLACEKGRGFFRLVSAC
jgi:hypothetical protein